jgi:hypothetical protein
MTAGPPDIIFLQSQPRSEAETGQAYDVESTSFILAAVAIKKAAMVEDTMELVVKFSVAWHIRYIKLV